MLWRTWPLGVMPRQSPLCVYKGLFKCTFCTTGEEAALEKLLGRYDKMTSNLSSWSSRIWQLPPRSRCQLYINEPQLLVSLHVFLFVCCALETAVVLIHNVTQCSRPDKVSKVRLHNTCCWVKVRWFQVLPDGKKHTRCAYLCYKILKKIKKQMTHLPTFL